MNNPVQISSHPNDRETLRQNVRPLLTERLAQWAIDPDAVYFTALDSLENRLVISSDSVVELVVQVILDNDEEKPLFPDWGGSGFFSTAYSFADEHRIPNPPPHEAFTEIVHSLIGPRS